HWSWHPITKPPTEKTITSVVLSLGENHHEIPGWVKPLVSERSGVFLLGPRGGEPLSWTQKSPPNYVERSHVLLGRTVDEGRVWDIIAAVRRLDADTGGKRHWKVIGRGQAGVLAAYAALFEPSIKEVIIVDPPASHRDG